MLDNFAHIDVVKEYSEMLLLDKSQATIRLYTDAIGRFLTFLNVQTIEDIKNTTPTKCRNYQAFLKEQGLQPSSINSHGRALRAFFNWMYLNEYIEENPFAKVKSVKQPKREKARLTKDEANAMINACKNLEEKIIMITLLSLGLRRSELVNLKVSDINNGETNIIGKGDKQRLVYYPDWAYEMVKEYLETRTYKDCQFLFCKLGKQYTGEAIRLKVKSIAKRAGLDEERIAMITPHTMRRTQASNMLASGASMEVIQGSLGHQNSETTRLYAKLGSSEIEKAMKNQERIG